MDPWGNSQIPDGREVNWFHPSIVNDLVKGLGGVDSLCIKVQIISSCASLNVMVVASWVISSHFLIEL